MSSSPTRSEPVLLSCSSPSPSFFALFLFDGSACAARVCVLVFVQPRGFVVRRAASGRAASGTRSSLVGRCLAEQEEEKEQAKAQQAGRCSRCSVSITIIVIFICVIVPWGAAQGGRLLPLAVRLLSLPASSLLMSSLLEGRAHRWWF